MENNELTKIDTYLIDVRAGLIKNKIIVITAACCIVLSIVVCAMIMVSGQNKAIEQIRIIDRQGYSYTSEIIDGQRATQLQMRAFLLNFCKLCYQFDSNNIEENLNRALQLGDGTVSGYIKKHQEPGGIYQAVTSLNRIAKINEPEFLNNLQILNNTFRSSFQQAIGSGGVIDRYMVYITGQLVYTTPAGLDNPNGFLITNFIETYEKYNPYE